MSSPNSDENPAPTVCVFDPSPLLTVTIETSGDEDDIHFHAGGQGFWIARMAHRLGAGVVLVGAVGGETGALIAPLVEAAGVGLAAVHAAGPNGSYVQDRRSGSRVSVASTMSAPLNRHEADDLYGAALAAAGNVSVAVLAGPSAPGIVPTELYGRLATDLHALGVKVVADISGPELASIQSAPFDVLKVSEEDMLRDGVLRAGDRGGLERLLRQWSDDGARTVILSRAEHPALALIDGRLVQIASPKLQPVDHRGAGDAMTAGVAVSLSRGESLEDSLRLGAAAGAVSVTRHGLASGHPDAVQAILEHIEVVKAVDEGADD